MDSYTSSLHAWLLNAPWFIGWNSSSSSHRGCTGTAHWPTHEGKHRVHQRASLEEFCSSSFHSSHREAVTDAWHGSDFAPCPEVPLWPWIWAGLKENLRHTFSWIWNHCQDQANLSQESTLSSCRPAAFQVRQETEISLELPHPFTWENTEFRSSSYTAKLPNSDPFLWKVWAEQIAFITWESVSDVQFYYSKASTDRQISSSRRLQSKSGWGFFFFWPVRKKPAMCYSIRNSNKQKQTG